MRLSISNEANDMDKRYVVDGLIDYNAKHFPDELKGRYQAVNLFLKNADGHTYGGLVGEICWNWMEIQYIYVSEDCRRSGYGNQLLQEAERLARDKRCDFMKLDTLSFQALDFYKKQGFEVYGTIANAGGHEHYYLKKDLI